MAEHNISAKAIVAYEPADFVNLKWTMQDVKLRQPADDELLVRIVASGICHTDIAMSFGPGLWPKVLGHEGAGIVEKVGSKITHAKPGDPVLLSFDFCTSCKNCSEGHPGYCPEFFPRNLIGQPGYYQTENGESGGGAFFGQSSFSSLALVKETSTLNVSDLIKSEEELKIFAPLGCGFQTGAGAITELANANEKDSVVIFGLGGVGLLAVMAAKIRGCHKIIGVDLVQSRLDMAKRLGATDTINSSDFKDLAADLSKALFDLTNNGGVSIAVDTTGVVPIVKAGIDSLATYGQMILVGILHGKSLDIDLGDVLGKGKAIRGCIEGSADPRKYIPQMIQWYRDGKLPVEQLIKHFPANDYGKALGEMHTGATIKPVLIW